MQADVGNLLSRLPLRQPLVQRSDSPRRLWRLRNCAWTRGCLFACNARVVQFFAEEARLTSEEAPDLFYHSQTYTLMSRGISDMHCMSDGYLSDYLKEELKQKRASITSMA